MNITVILFSLFALTSPLHAFPYKSDVQGKVVTNDSLRYDQEVHLKNIKQLTFGGNNAEAYWSMDDRELVFQSDWGAINNAGCDQIFRMRVDGSTIDGKKYVPISRGKGRTTCSYFMTDGRILFGSTHGQMETCPAPVLFAGNRYVWPIYKEYDVYIANPDGSDIKPFISGEGYDAEATVSPDGKYVLFTSTRSGDLELWRYEVATGNLLQLTNALGYDGGAFFSRDSKYIVWRASRPTGEEAQKYQDLLQKGFVEPGALNIYVSDIEGKNVKQVTNLPGANWAPFFHPDGKRILFSSNHHTMNRGGREFAIFMINLDGTGLKQITYSGNFDAFPMFSYDGKKIVFASNRNAKREPSRDTNVFVADWVE
jgi:Tol biopolymer transport system component